MKRLNLGDTFTCECGEAHPFTGAWLAAHWREDLRFECKCGRVYTLRSGEVTIFYIPDPPRTN